MEIISQFNSLKCINHPHLDILFIKINDLKNSNQIFYCEICIEEDDFFKPLNFLRINKLFFPDNKFIHKWPPICNNNITQKLFKITNNIEQSQNLEQKIINFFDDLKKEINSKIDNCQKSLLKLASEIPELNNKILKNFKDLAKADSFQNILENKELDIQGKENQLRDLINLAHCQKYQKTEQFNDILKEIDEQYRFLNFEIPNTFKSQILSLIENITFFEKINCENEYSLQFDFKNKQIEDILPNLQMIYQPDVKRTQNDEMEIKKLISNKIEIICKINSRFYSNFILDKNKKYIFRLSTNVHAFNDQIFTIALIHDKYKDQNNLNDDQFYRKRFKYSKKDIKLISIKENDFIKQREDDWDKIIGFKNIEIRVDLQNEIFEILDYPNYKYKFLLNQKEKKKLKNNNYRFYLSSEGEINLTLTSAFICQQFNN